MIEAAVEYRTIPGFGGYRIGDDGSVWSLRSGTNARVADWRRQETYPHVRGHKMIALYRHGKRHVRTVHCLLLAAFIGPPLGRHVQYVDGDRQNPVLSNLRYIEPSENMEGRKGEDHYRSKLTEDQVWAIRILSASGWSGPRIATCLGPKLSAVADVLSGKAWSWLKWDGVGEQ